MPVASREPVVGVLLAGGLARRMGGGDKCLLELGGGTLLEHAIARLAPQVDTIILNANGDPERFARYGLPVVADTIEGFAGPLAGILSGLSWTRANRPEARWIVTAAADTPFLPRDLVTALQGAAEDRYPAIALAASASRIHPVFGLWPVALADDLKVALDDGTRKILDWTDRHDMISVEFSVDGTGGLKIDPFFNINRPEDLSRAEELIAEI